MRFSPSFPFPFSFSLLFFSFLFLFLSARIEKGNAEKAAAKDNKIEPERPKSEGETEEQSKNPSNGFGTDIDWVPWDQSVSVALDLNRPIFLLIHKSWCGACDALKKSFATSPKRKELLELSKQFVMSNTEDEDEPEDEEFAPDGRYIPRLFILNKFGKRLAVDNKKNYPSNVAYFPQVPDVIRAMKMGLEEWEKEQRGAEKTEGKETVAEREKKKNTGAESAAEKKSAKSEKKSKDEELKAAEDEGGKGGCPHAAGKAAAKKKREEEAKKKQTEEKSAGKKEEKSAGKKEAGETKKQTEEKSAGKKETEEKKTDAKKAEQQKKKKGTEKEKGEL